MITNLFSKVERIGTIEDFINHSFIKSGIFIYIYYIYRLITQPRYP